MLWNQRQFVVVVSVVVVVVVGISGSVEIISEVVVGTVVLASELVVAVISETVVALSGGITVVSGTVVVMAGAVEAAGLVRGGVVGPVVIFCGLTVSSLASPVSSGVTLILTRGVVALVKLGSTNVLATVVEDAEVVSCSSVIIAETVDRATGRRVVKIRDSVVGSKESVAEIRDSVVAGAPTKSKLFVFLFASIIFATYKTTTT